MARPQGGWGRFLVSIVTVETLPPPEQRDAPTLPPARPDWLSLLFLPEELPEEHAEPEPERRSWLRTLLGPESLE